LDLEFTPVPACLRGVVMRVYHRVVLNSIRILGREECSGILAFFCLCTLIMDRASILFTLDYQLFVS
jgi:hypothetical protein